MTTKEPRDEEQPGYVYIPENEYNDLLEDQKILRALMAAGVDNWEGYDFAFEGLESY